MIFNILFRIPYDFLDSANESNNFESPSELFAKAIISTVFTGEDVRKGNPDIREPDYITKNGSYEVTLAISKEIVPQLRGFKKLDNKNVNIENELKTTIQNALKRKALKDYSTKPNLIIIALQAYHCWTLEADVPTFFEKCSNDAVTAMFNRIASKTLPNGRNELFDKIYDDYISTRSFNNVYVIMPCLKNGKYMLFDIKEYSLQKESGSGGISLITANKRNQLPFYIVNKVDNRPDDNEYRITVEIVKGDQQ